MDGVPEASDERLLTWPFLLAFAANFIHGLAIMAFFHLPGFVAGMGAEEGMVGLVFGTASGAAILIRPWAGRIMDMSGRRLVILGGGVLHVVACLLFLTVSSLGPWIFVVRILQGFAIGALFSSIFTYAADIIPASKRTQGMGIFGVSGMLPMSVGTLLGAAVLEVGTYTTLFWSCAGLSMLGLVLTLPMPEPERQKTGGGGFFGAATQRDLVPVWFVGTAMATALAALFTFVKGYTEDHLGYGSVGLFFSGYTATAVALRLFLGWLPDRVGPMKVFYPSMVFLALAMVVLSRAEDAWWIGIGGALAGIGHGYAFPILSAIAVTRANPADRGSAMSLFTAIFDLGILVGSPLLGFLVEATNYRTMYLCAAALPLAGTAIFHLWDVRARQPA